MVVGICVAANGACVFCAQLRLRIFYFEEDEKMKKLLVVILAMVMLVSFTGCGAKCSVEGCKNEIIEETSFEADLCSEHLIIKCVEAADSYVSSHRFEKEYNYIFSGNYLEEENAYIVVMQLKEEAVDGLVALSTADANMKSLLRSALISSLDNDEELISILLSGVVGEVGVFFEGTDVEVAGGYMDYSGNVTYTVEANTEE